MTTTVVVMKNPLCTEVQRQLFYINRNINFVRKYKSNYFKILKILTHVDPFCTLYEVQRQLKRSTTTTVVLMTNPLCTKVQKQLFNINTKFT